MHKTKGQQPSEVSCWVAYHIAAAMGAQIRIYAHLMAQRRSKIATTSLDPEKLLRMTPEKFFETVPKRILGMNPDLEQIMLYMVCINEHLTKMLRFIPKTPQVCRVIERANRDTISLATTYWIPKYECNPLAEDGGFKTANEYRTAGERQEER